MLIPRAGERTFGVLTKLDLMDKGTNALDVSSLELCLRLPDIFSFQWRMQELSRMFLHGG